METTQVKNRIRPNLKEIKKTKEERDNIGDIKNKNIWKNYEREEKNI